MALQNWLFGLGQPFVGARADKHGAGRVVLAGALLYALGLVGAAFATDAIGLHISFGIFIGMAQSATTFVVVLGAVGRVVSPEKRSGAFRSEEHTSELQSLMRFSYAVFCLEKKRKMTLSSYYALRKHDTDQYRIRVT